MLDVDDGYVAGEMNIPVRRPNKLGEPDFNTLDEPIRETIASSVCFTSKHIMKTMSNFFSAQGCKSSRYKICTRFISKRKKNTA